MSKNTNLFESLLKIYGKGCFQDELQQIADAVEKDRCENGIEIDVKTFYNKLEQAGVQCLTRKEPYCQADPNESVEINVFDKLIYCGTNITPVIKMILGDYFKDLVAHVEVIHN